jgi:hypothetical protein
MGMSPREIEEKELARRHKIRKRYYWNGMELRMKSPVREEQEAGTVSKLWGKIRRLPKVIRSQS